MACASFSTLPLELKTRIVEMTSEQEDAFKERVRGSDERAGHINGLSSLALVNKELRTLAAKHQFKTLSTVRGQASRPLFRFTILPRHGHHITEVVLAGSKERQLDDVLAILSHLPALHTLALSHAAAVALFGPAVALLPNPSGESDAAACRADMLEHISSKITSLTLSKFSPLTSVALVRRFRNLRTLVLRNLGAVTDAKVIESFTTEIATLDHLSHLVITLDEDVTTGWPTEAFGALGSNPPSLRTLQLIYFPLDHDTLNLISLFGSTLETLSLELWAPEPELDLSSHNPLQLPRLATLNLTLSKRANFKETIRILIRNSNLSSLSYNRPSTGLLEPTMPDLVAALDSQPALRRVQFGESVVKHPITKLPPSKDLAVPSSLAAYANLVHSRGLDPSVLDRPHLTPFHPEAQLDYTENEGKYLAGTLRRTLEFGLIELDRMAAEGRAANAVEWVPILKPLEDKRLAWKD